MEKANTPARRFWVSGQVQGVGYRYFAARVARELGLRGWVRNLSDGRVEAYAAGPVRRLEDFEGRLRQGPPAGDVRGVEVEDVASGAHADARIEGFDIR
jgi:acylphosphatase